MSMMARKSVGGNQPTLDMVFFLTLNNAVSNFFGVVVFLFFVFAFDSFNQLFQCAGNCTKV